LPCYIRDRDRHRDSRSRDREKDRHGADYDDAEQNYKKDVAMSDEGHGDHGYGQYDQQGDDGKYNYSHGQGKEYYGQHYGGEEDTGYNGQMNHGGRGAPEEGEAYDERDYGYFRED
jgi:hypothetical protein